MHASPSTARTARLQRIPLAACAAAALGWALGACTTVSPSSYDMTTKVPGAIVTPEVVDTRLGVLRFQDGVPTEATAQKARDQLAFSRGIEAFLAGIPGASLIAMRRALREAGAIDGTIGIFDDPLDSRPLLLTGDTASVYATTWLDLTHGPIVIESPLNVAGALHDFWFRPVAALGPAAASDPPGGRLLVLPPGYAGEPPPGYRVVRSPTFNNWLVWRAVAPLSDAKPAAEAIRQAARVYPLSQAGQAQPPKFVALSGRELNTVHANDLDFFTDLHTLIQEEPEDAFGADTMGLFNAIGLVKGQPFEPSGRMKRILADAASLGNAAARAMLFRDDRPDARIYPDGSWMNSLAAGGPPWLTPGGARQADARSLFFYATALDAPATPATAATPATPTTASSGIQSALASLDVLGDPFDGNKSYRLRLPAGVPVKDFWTVAVYDPQTRSLLQTDQRQPAISSRTPPRANADGYIDIYFSAKRPDEAANWIQTVPGKRWFAIFRLHGPLQPWFDKSWRLPDIEPQ